MGVSELDAVLRLTITAIQLAQTAGINIDKVSRMVEQAKAEGRDITTEELAELRGNVQAKIDAL